MKLIKIDETLIEIPDHNYTELVSPHKKHLVAMILI